MQIYDLAEIRPLTAKDLADYATCRSQEFFYRCTSIWLDAENAPAFTAYITNEKLKEKISDGYDPFGFFVGEKIVGFVSLTNMGNGAFELGLVRKMASAVKNRRFGGI